MFLIQNEQAKLTASWFNSLATALIAAGFFAPAAALLYGLTKLAIGLEYMIAVTLGCLGLGVAIHLIGRAVLGRLRE